MELIADIGSLELNWHFEVPLNLIVMSHHEELDIVDEAHRH